MAKGFKTGGRQKGAPNRTTSEMRRAIAESGEMPVEYMVRVMRDENADPSRRDHMARAAASYLHPRLSVADQTFETNHNFVVQLPEVIEDVREWEKKAQAENIRPKMLYVTPEKTNGQ
jgi:hypothetical protein